MRLFPASMARGVAGEERQPSTAGEDTGRMFNQECGAGEGKAAETCPNLHASSKRLPGWAKWLLWLPSSVRTQGGLKWKDRGSSQAGPQLPALAFGFVKCLRFARRAFTQKKRRGGRKQTRKDRDGRGVQRRAPAPRGSSPAVTAQLLCLAKVVFGTSPLPLLV